MTWIFAPVVLALLCVLAVAAYIDRIYFEIGKFLSREYTENIEAWEERVEPRLLLSRDSAALSASVLRQIALGALAFLLALHIHASSGHAAAEIGSVVFELFLALLVFDRLIPQLFFTRTRGLWIVRISFVVRGFFYLILPVTLAISLILSIAGLAEPEVTEDEHPNEGVDALLEAGEEEGILQEHDRELVRSVVEFGDKVVREVMTPRPEIFAVPATMSLEVFTMQVNEHGFSRVPVFTSSIDEITGVIFARDMLGVKDSEAAVRTVAELQRPAAFTPESKKVNELLREMQREKQHMSLVIDEYGGVAGIVTIEDLLEAIVGDIEDEHDAPADDAPIAEPGGVFVVPGSFEVGRLRELFDDAIAPDVKQAGSSSDSSPDNFLSQLLEPYEAATVGGLVSEIAGHIPHPGEIVEDGPLRLEVVASTDRLVEKVRLSLVKPLSASEPE